MLKKIYHHILYYFLPRKLAHKLLYYKHYHKSLNLKNPKDLNEKIHYLIINNYGQKEADLTDKIKVKEILTEKNIENLHIIKNIETYNTPSEIDFEKLPNKFVIKCNNGSGDVIVVKDKNNVDANEINTKIARYYNRKFYTLMLEYHYELITPKILCEEYLEAEDLMDYKLFCFNGEPNCVLVCSDRQNGNYRDYYDLNWNYLDYTEEKFRSPIKHEKPTNFDEMIKIAKDISKDFIFCRVDLYNVNGVIYFGEITFSPNAGFFNNLKPEALNYLGSLIELDKKE